MGTVAINPPKTPVTKGSSGIAAATLPNICKMPGPPAPFVPTPLPNIGKSGDSPKGYSKSVTIDGQPVAIAGASFGSQGDMASKGTGGGLVSSNTHGPTKFIGPGSMNVQIEGKSVQLLSDPMLNNCGPGGSPANAATMTGIVQMAKAVAVTYGDDKPCTRKLANGQECGRMHPLDAGAESLSMIRSVFKALQKAFDAQKAQIRDLNHANVALSTKNKAFMALRLKATKTAEDQATMATLNVEIKALSARVRALESFFKANALLRLDRDYGTYSKGYMVGVMVCLCKGKRLGACSGAAPPCFKAIISSAGFECASPAVGTTGSTARTGGGSDAKATWACAAKQIMEKHGGHKPHELIERWFSPMVKGLKHPKGNAITQRSPKIVFEALVEHPQTKVVTREAAYVKDDFKTGDNVPSCSKCQNWLAEMYCDTKCG
ncbi:DUF4150 domain-containing protein [Myxococcus stipitatus]|uniref:PAAR-like domain-containing protein n=1 Tax=Myxococcus stipitatus TaxID=83455 RepID=UPI00314521F7